MYLGLDIGTSAVKAVLLDETGAVVGEASERLSVQSPRPYWSEQAPEDWWQAVALAVSQLPGRGAVRAIGLSGQMHGAVLLDGRGRVIRPAILWNDGRAHVQAARLARDDHVAGIGGVVPMAGLTAPKLMWLKEHEPSAYGRIATVLSPKDYIGFRLHGALATDVSDAAGTLWFDQAHRRWSPRLAEASDTDPVWLPPVLEGADVAGQLSRRAAEELGLNPGLPVAAGAGDTVAGCVGMGLVVPGRALVGLGTSGQVLTVTDSYLPVSEGLIHAFAHTLPGLWYRMGAMQNGARPLGWFAGVANRPLADLLMLAEASDPDRAPLFLPYLTGERTPLGDPHIRGAFQGLGDATDAGAMMRAVVEAVAYSFADAATALTAGGVGFAGPLAVGGGAQSDLVLQVLADVLGTPVQRPAGAGVGAAQGAARLAALSDGGDPEEVLRPPAVAAVFTPDPAQAARHGERLAQFRAFGRAMQSLG